MNSEAARCADYASNRTNVTQDPWDYISCFFGPQRQEIWIAVSVTVINAIIFITGLLGNLAVCIVIFKQPMLHTATNYYLFNLAISDVTLLIFGLPNDVALYWHQYPWPLGEALCKIRALISETASYVSVLTIVAFSTERYIAICHPLHIRAVSGLRRAVWAVAGLWVGALCAAIPFAVLSGVHYVYYPWNDENAVPLPESAMCAMVTQPENVPLTEMSTILFFVIPLLIIAVQYINMAVTISRTTHNTLGKRINGSVHRTRKKVQSNKNVIRMLSFVVLGFFICWAPFHAQRLVAIYFRDTDYFDEINYWMYCITGLFYYFSSTLNPILYNVMSDRMRNAFKEVILGKKPKGIVKQNSAYRDVSHAYLSHQNSTMNTHLFNEDEERAQLVKKEDSLVLYAPTRFQNRSFYSQAKMDYNFMCKKSNETCI